MGDCRIRIILAKELLSKERQNRISAAKETSVAIIRMYSADTTVREVAESTHEVWDLYSADADFQLWDCTVYPPKNITDWPVEQFPGVTGPSSKTLHDAGWFPSGTWMVLPPQVEPSQFNHTNYEEFQYNQQQQILISSGKVDFTSSSLIHETSKPLPSEVMASATNRFDEDSVLVETQVKEARAQRLVNQANELKRRRDRTAKLDQRIQRLEALSSEKTKKVSDQVRRMLVKSRATGDKRLEQKDRLYFECVVDKGADETIDRAFRFFSPQDTFARVGSSFDRPKERNLSNVEVLVKRKGKSGEEYLRLPATMRFFEAISGKFLTGELDTIIVRWFSEDSDATTSVLDIDGEDESIRHINTAVGDVGAAGSSFAKEEAPASATAVVDISLSVEGDAIKDEQLTASIMKMDGEKAKNPKKGSTAATKVRNMLMKSKALGDSKRTPKIEDRFFLEVVLADKATRSASSNFYFLANRDPLERILQSMGHSSSGESLDFFVPLDTVHGILYKRIEDTSIQLSEAASQGILNSFDRLILHPK